MIALQTPGILPGWMIGVPLLIIVALLVWVALGERQDWNKWEESAPIEVVKPTCTCGHLKTEHLHLGTGPCTGDDETYELLYCDCDRFQKPVKP